MGFSYCRDQTGNGTRPQIWAAVSSLLFELMKQDGFFVTMVGAFSLVSWSLVGFAFVNNTDLCITHPLNQATAVAKHMQGSVSNWEGLLWASGKALIPDKCFWYLLDFEYKHGHWNYMAKQQLTSLLFVHDAAGAHTTISRLEPYEVHHTLGVHRALDGNVAVELQYLWTVACQWQVKMAPSRLSPKWCNVQLMPGHLLQTHLSTPYNSIFA